MQRARKEVYGEQEVSGALLLPAVGWRWPVLSVRFARSVESFSRCLQRQQQQHLSSTSRRSMRTVRCRSPSPLRNVRLHRSTCYYQRQHVSTLFSVHSRSRSDIALHLTVFFSVGHSISYGLNIDRARRETSKRRARRAKVSTHDRYATLN